MAQLMLEGLIGAVRTWENSTCETPSSVAADLRGTNLSSCQLEGADLRLARYDASTRVPEGFDLLSSGAVGPKARLSGVFLNSTDLRGMDLRGAVLMGAYLSGADLSGALLDNVRLVGSDLRHAILTGCHVPGDPLWHLPDGHGRSSRRRPLRSRAGDR